MNQISRPDDWWQPLGLPNSYISLRKAADLGPSGADPGAQSRRQSAFEKLEASKLGIKPVTANCLICHQVHSLHIVVLLVGQAPLLILAVWNKNGHLEFSEKNHCHGLGNYSLGGNGNRIS